MNRTKTVHPTHVQVNFNRITERIQIEKIDVLKSWLVISSEFNNNNFSINILRKIEKFFANLPKESFFVPEAIELFKDYQNLAFNNSTLLKISEKELAIKLIQHCHHPEEFDALYSFISNLNNSENIETRIKDRFISSWPRMARF